MGTFQLVIKQMRQRALGTWLTLLSVVLGVALAIAILLLRDAGQALFGQTEYGFDAIVGVGKGSPTQLVMNTVYHIDRSPGNLPYWVYEQLNTQSRARGREFDFHRHVKLAVPTAVGDVYLGRPIVGTLPKMFVSLAPLQDAVEKLMRSQDAITRETSEDGGGSKPPAPDLPTRQAAIESDVQSLQQRVAAVDRDTVPLLLPPSVDGPPTKYKYGDFAYSACDDARQEAHAATQALRGSKPSEATGHQTKLGALLRSVYDAVNAASGPLEYRPGQTYEIAEGRVFHAWKFEAVIGSEVAQKTGLKIGGQFQATHGSTPPGEAPDVHPEKWAVVGVLKPTHTASDRCLYIPLMTFYSIAEHEVGLQQHDQARNGQALGGQAADEAPKYQLAFGDELAPDLPHAKDFISLDVPPKEWELSAILVKARGDIMGQRLLYYVANGGIPDVQAVNPAEVMRVFFETFLKSSADILLLISLLVSIVAGVGILVSIYNSVSARTREIAILRALGATRTRVLTLICAEAVLIGLSGGLVGMAAGHGLGAVASAALNNRVGQGFNWVGVRADEWLYLVIVTAIALVAGLVPALKAYKTPVATNLTAG